MTAPALIDYNPFDPDFYTTRAFETYRRLRDEAPVWHSREFGWYALTRFEDVRAAVLDPDLYRSFEGMDIDNTFTEQMTGGGSLANIDNPRHDEIRAIVQPWFVPRSIGGHEEAVRKVVREHLAKWRDRGTVDLAQEISWPTPFDTFFSLMGIPYRDREERDQLERWTHELKGRVPGTPDFTPVALEADSRIREYFVKLLQDRRTNPQNDVISTIVHAKINGVPFTDEHIEPAAEVMGLMVILYLGGVESTAGLIGNTFKLLAEHPDQRRLLLEDPSLIPAAVEESVRWVTPLQLTARTVMRDVTLHGVTIPARSRVVLVTGAANRDERHFPDPDRFDVRRGAVKHVGFGEGVHGCLGAHLARLEAKIVLQEALPVLGEYELDGDPVFYPSSPNMYVWWKLPVRFAPGAGRAAETPGAPSASTKRLETEVRVATKTAVAEGVVALELQAADDQPLPAWEPGAHVDLVLPGARPTRQYSLSGDPTDRATYRLGILREANGGGGSMFVHDELAAGAALRIRGPRNNFQLVASPRYLFIAGGIGITPILPMIRAAEAAGADWQLVYGGRTRASMAFTDELASCGDRVRLRPQDEFGLLDLAAILGTPQADTLVYCCGPEPLLAAVERRCTESGWPAGALHVERFSPKPRDPNAVDRPFEVVLRRSGRTLSVPADRSILEVLEASGIEAMSSCGRGTCGTCETRVLEGVVDHRDAVLGEAERAANESMMICCSRSTTPRLVLDA